MNHRPLDPLRFPVILRWFFIGWLAAVPGCQTREPRPHAAAVTLDSKRFDPFAPPIARGRVLIFVGTTCPIANRYAPEIQRLAHKFSGAGIDFVLVYPEPDITLDEIRAHLRDYRYSLTAVHDPHHRLVKLAHARVTPEVAVFDAQRKLIYRGRIDDRNVALGQSRPEPRRRDLQDALDRLVLGQPIVAPVTEAIGCYINTAP